MHGNKQQTLHDIHRESDQPAAGICYTPPQVYCTWSSLGAVDSPPTLSRASTVHCRYILQDGYFQAAFSYWHPGWGILHRRSFWPVLARQCSCRQDGPGQGERHRGWCQWGRGCPPQQHKMCSNSNWGASVGSQNIPGGGNMENQRYYIVQYYCNRSELFHTIEGWF